MKLLKRKLFKKGHKHDVDTPTVLSSFIFAASAFFPQDFADPSRQRAEEAADGWRAPLGDRFYLPERFPIVVVVGAGLGHRPEKDPLQGAGLPATFFRVREGAEPRQAEQSPVRRLHGLCFALGSGRTGRPWRLASRCLPFVFVQ